MKYLLLVYSNHRNWEHPMFLRDPVFEALPADEREAVARAADALFEEITASGELVVGSALADPVHTVRLSSATDGPFAEAKEQLAGYFVVDCDSPERAAEIAARFPDVRFGAVEVRPIMGSSGQEM